MINLLTPSARQIIIRIYWLRMSTVWLTAIGVAACIAAALLLPPYVLITSQVAAYQSDASDAAAKIENYRAAAAELVTASNQAGWIVSGDESEHLLPLIAQLEALTIPDIRVTSITVRRTDAGIGPVIIAGEASRRLPLISYLETLQASPLVARAYYPNTNLSTGTDIPFTVEVTLAPSTP